MNEFFKQQAAEMHAFDEKQKKEREAFEAKQKQQAEREARRQADRERFNSYKETKIDMLKDDYGFNQDVAEKIFNRAWDEGHSCGYNEVDWHLDDLADFVDEIMCLQYEKNKN